MSGTARLGSRAAETATSKHGRAFGDGRAKTGKGHLKNPVGHAFWIIFLFLMF